MARRSQFIENSFKFQVAQQPQKPLDESNQLRKIGHSNLRGHCCKDILNSRIRPKVLISSVNTYVIVSQKCNEKLPRFFLNFKTNLEQCVRIDSEFPSYQINNMVSQKTPKKGSFDRFLIQQIVFTTLCASKLLWNQSLSKVPLDILQAQ